MPLQKITFKPGIYRESTDYAAEGRWFDGNLVRFRDGFPEPIQGWEKAVSTAFYGKCRDMHLWSELDGTIYIFLGTHLKAYAFDGGVYHDITPIRATATIDTDPFSVTSGSADVTVTHTSHGARLNDFVTYSGATGPIGGIDESEFNSEHQITEIVDVDTYKYTTTTTATGTASGGGAVVEAEYQLSAGLDSTFYGSGWGAGSWGRGGWGSAADTSTEGERLRIWSSWNYGEDLVFCPRDGAIYFWDGTTTRGVLLSSVSGANGTPGVTKEVAVSNERHVIAFGCTPYGSSTQDRLLVRWTDKENYLEWQPLPENAAGDLRIPLGSYFVTHIQTTQEILVWTDVAVHSMRYVGEPFTYGIDVQASKATVAGPKAKCVANDTVYWMGNGRFYKYRGAVEVLPCSVLEYVFNNLNQSQRDKIYAGTNVTWNEVTWHYPSMDSDECDLYVTYNYADNTWYYGSMARTAWLDRPDLSYPMAVSTDGYLYYHDFGTTDGSTNPGSYLPAYIESSFFELDEGRRYAFVDQLIPDITFRNCDPTSSPSVTVTLTPSDWPGDANSTDGTMSGSVSRTSAVDASVEAYTQYVNLRMRGRAMKMRIASPTTPPGITWRVGVQRIRIRPDGRQ